MTDAKKMALLGTLARAEMMALSSDQATREQGRAAVAIITRALSRFRAR